MILGQSLNILCFGDSLTAGFSFVHGLEHLHPYEVAMKATLQAAFPTYKVTTDVQGVSGDQVLTPPGGFLTRMDICFKETHPVSPYTHAVILGGTNDLYQQTSPSVLFQALKEVWAIPLEHKTTVLALTVPECPICENVPVERYDKLNNAILEREKVGSGGDQFHTLDLYHIIPWVSLPEERRKALWDDGVHFSPEGYNLMGQVIARELIKIINKENKIVEKNEEVAREQAALEEAQRIGNFNNELKRRDHYLL
ncbi:SGNH hydrolase-type esterase domain-containing protein [Amylocarpus encephaloides]|uniref:SGNH hydrolase-type esterase domain-containing protein n=1 Tax=Amylocarpus encephaloides TaxID=45428 RepID=A0A9P7YPZ7_9HELO|nr:SGNH hydrolase-type esterase domain-containing protein [Amylocarpus encephaloides]